MSGNGTGTAQQVPVPSLVLVLTFSTFGEILCNHLATLLCSICSPYYL